jgi:hypothetical protein
VVVFSFESACAYTCEEASLLTVVTSANGTGLDVRTYLITFVALGSPILFAFGMLCRFGARWRLFRITGFTLMAALAACAGLAFTWSGSERGLAGATAVLIFVTLALTFRAMVPWLVLQRELSEQEHH